MNKLIASAFLSLLGLAMATQQAAAWGCHPCCLCCKCKICVSASQYNAFSPFCVDNVSYHGCCPGLFFPNNNCCQSPCCDSGCCTGSDCCDGGVLGQLPAPGAVQPTAPKSGQPGFKAPMPTPANDGRTMAPAMQSYPQVYPAGLQPNYYPGYYPAYGATPGQMPGY